MLNNHKSTLAARSLSKSYNGRKVVDGVSFSIDQGEIIALLGPNGAGKTTSFDVVVGLVNPDVGCIELDSIDITSTKIHDRAHMGIGYLTQEPSAFRNLSVRDNLALVLELHGYDAESRKVKTQKILEEFGIFHLKDTNAISLSGGERRRLEIARVLVTDPKFILLDEPFTGIDPIAINEIQVIIHNLCKQKNIGLLITDHNPAATLSITDRAYIMRDGKIIREGSSHEIANDELVKKHYLGANFKL
ncbi:MAG: LPS export ABC transporter ATP-binding protein [Candidatus Melainabacteria bacterium]|nr:LPS export ABC transporter ATP-binding protein [Candidatus Melainabacteria bacterium]